MLIGLTNSSNYDHGAQLKITISEKMKEEFSDLRGGKKTNN